MIGRVRRTYHAFPQRPLMVQFSLIDRTMEFQLRSESLDITQANIAKVPIFHLYFRWLLSKPTINYQIQWLRKYDFDLKNVKAINTAFNYFYRKQPKIDS